MSDPFMALTICQPPERLPQPVACRGELGPWNLHAPHRCQELAQVEEQLARLAQLAVEPAAVTRVCAWCPVVLHREPRVLALGAPGGLTSHGLCDDCRVELERQAGAGGRSAPTPAGGAS